MRFILLPVYVLQNTADLYCEILQQGALTGTARAVTTSPHLDYLPSQCSDVGITVGARPDLVLLVLDDLTAVLLGSRQHSVDFSMRLANLLFDGPLQSLLGVISDKITLSGWSWVSGSLMQSLLNCVTTQPFAFVSETSHHVSGRHNFFCVVLRSSNSANFSGTSESSLQMRPLLYNALEVQDGN